jgi:hypothetical protein
MRKNSGILLVFVFLFAAMPSFSQFFQGFGIMGGLTLGKQKWWIENSSPPFPSSTTEKHKYLFGFNGELFAEFVNHPTFRWRTEFEFDRKGTKHRETKERNKLDYISWNNFLVVRGETYDGYPYFLIGPRLEYKFSQSTPSVPLAFTPLHLSWSVGAGFEFITFGNIKPMVELHYNPDLNSAMNQKIGDEGNWKIKNRAWELRAGIKFTFGNNGCPPVYK